MDETTVEPEQSGELCLTQSGRGGSDGLEGRLDVRRGTGNDPQDLAGRRLFVQRLGQVLVTRLQFLEEPNVLDGNDGLVGEGFEKLDLTRGEWPRFASQHRDRAD